MLGREISALSSSIILITLIKILPGEELLCQFFYNDPNHGLGCTLSLFNNYFD